MKIVRQISEIIKTVNHCKSMGNTIGFIPTMGALHEGHVSLLNKSLEICDISIVSIYVNPSQFNESLDFLTYPRNEITDISILKEAGCDVVFMPEVADIDSLALPGSVELGDLGNIMEGSNRPGHFKGVIDVVYRLFSLVKPDKSFFGEKDFQQLMVIRKMVEHTNLNIEIVNCKILRESSGLAMSSRNAKLTPDGKNKAARIYDILVSSKFDSNSLKLNELNRLGFEVEYLTQHKLDGFSRLFVAVWIEGVRLIDNIAID